MGGMPCAADEQGVSTYDAFITCAESIPAEGSVHPCSSVLAHGPIDSACILAIQALAPPCSSSYSTCYSN
jgi:hypothetical protein